MEQWPIILVGALAGGLLVLHGFGKTKATNDLFLNTYRDLLAEAGRCNEEDEGRENGENPHARKADEPARHDEKPGI